VPYSQDDFNVRLVGRYVRVATSFGLNVTYDGNAYLQVALTKKFSGKVEGKAKLEH